MNMKAGKNMRGFMCQSPGASAACMASEPLSVIVQQRSLDRNLADRARFINNAKYIRLGSESRKYASTARIQRTTPVPSLTVKSNQEKPPKIASSLAVKDQAFQVNKYASTARVQRSATAPSLTVKSNEEKPPKVASSLAVKDQIFQVVVMRVSLHCQGCAGKVKKHLSKMEGVTSFSIDLESKRVTVMGNISPNGVLESLSKVKRAELWPC